MAGTEIQRLNTITKLALSHKRCQNSTHLKQMPKASTSYHYLQKHRFPQVIVSQELMLDPNDSTCSAMIIIHNTKPTCLDDLQSPTLSEQVTIQNVSTVLQKRSGANQVSACCDLLGFKYCKYVKPNSSVPISEALIAR